MKPEVSPKQIYQYNVDCSAIDKQHKDYKKEITMDMNNKTKIKFSQALIKYGFANFISYLDEHAFKKLSKKQSNELFELEEEWNHRFFTLFNTDDLLDFLTCIIPASDETNSRMMQVHYLLKFYIESLPEESVTIEMLIEDKIRIQMLLKLLLKWESNQ